MGIFRALLLTLAVCAGALAGCRGEKRTTVSVLGSTSIQPFAEMLAQEFNKRHDDLVVEVQGGGSAAGIQTVASGIAEIGMCSRELKGDEHYTAIPIARDGIAVVVHASNPVSELALDQVRDMFAGKTARWSQVGGPDQPIRLVTREEGSGTREAFTKLVMQNQRMSRRALTQISNGAVRELVSNDPDAVGFMSAGQVEGSVKALTVNGVPPTAENIRADRYPLARPFLFVVKDAPTPNAQRFIDFVLSPESQTMLETEGLVRIK